MVTDEATQTTATSIDAAAAEAMTKTTKKKKKKKKREYVMAVASRAVQQGTAVSRAVATVAETTVSTAMHKVTSKVHLLASSTAAATATTTTSRDTFTKDPATTTTAQVDVYEPVEHRDTQEHGAEQPKSKTGTPSDSVFIMGPMLEFISADATLLFVFVVSAALHPTWKHWDSVWEVRRVISSVLMPWLLAAFCFGLALGQLLDSHRFRSLTQAAVPAETVGDSEDGMAFMGRAALRRRWSWKWRNAVEHGSFRSFRKK
jgi:hypothetical protein